MTRLSQRSWFRFLPLGLLAAVSACSSAGENPVARADEVDVAHSASQALVPMHAVYRMRSAHAPDWVLRLSLRGDRIEGHAVAYVSVRESSNAQTGSVTGTVDALGSIRLEIQPPEPWAPPLYASPDGPAVFTGVVTAWGLEGTLTYRSESERVFVSPVPRGTFDETGAPLAAPFRAVSSDASCAVDVGAVEFFSLANETLEHKLNGHAARIAADAPLLCATGVDAVSGGVRVTLLRRDVVSLASVFTILHADQFTTVARPERKTFDLSTGDELALFGDVLRPGSEAALAASLQTAIDRIRADVLDDEDRAALRAHVTAALADGRLAKRFGLSEDGLVFDVMPEFSHPHITALRVGFDTIRGALAPNGRASSAWNTTP